MFFKLGTSDTVVTKNASIFLQLFVMVGNLPKSNQISPQLLFKRPLSPPDLSRIAGRGSRERRKSRNSLPSAMVKKNLARDPIMQGKILHKKCHLTMRNAKLHCNTVLLSLPEVALSAVAAVSHTDGFIQSTSRYPFSSAKRQFFINLSRFFSWYENSVSVVVCALNVIHQRKPFSLGKHDVDLTVQLKI